VYLVLKKLIKDTETNIKDITKNVTENIKTLETIIKSGVTVLRLNLKHNNYEWHAEMVNKIRKVAKKLNKTVAIMADLQGPELRTGNYPDKVESFYLKPKDTVIFGEKQIKDTLFIPFNKADSKLNDRVRFWGCEVANWGKPEHIAGVMQNCDYYVGTRVHGDVTATAYNIPFLSIGYTQPNINYLKHIEYPHYIDTSTTEVTKDLLVSEFTKIIDNESILKAELEKVTNIAKISYDKNCHKLCKEILG